MFNYYICYHDFSYKTTKKIYIFNDKLWYNNTFNTRKKHMKNTVEALKYWKKMQEQEKIVPQAHIYTNIRNQGVNMEDLAQKSPFLFDMFTRIFSGVETEENIKLWNNYKKAYEELEKSGALNIKSVRDEKMQNLIDDFIKKVEGENRIPLNELEEVITEKKRKGNVSIQVEFNDYMDLIEKHYDFQHRDFFKKHGKDNSEIIKVLGLTKNEYNKYANIRPADNLISAKICVLTSIHDEINGMPYVDFWHHLLDRDFAEISNGSVTTMWIDDEYDEDEDDEDEIKVKDVNTLFHNMRKVIFKEISQYPYYNGEQPEEIEFHIWW